MTTEEAMNLALQRHQAGQLAQAEAIYRQILSQQPAHPGATHLLGLLAYQSGRFEVALELIGQAIALNPNIADYHLNLGVVFSGLGRFPEAIQSFRRALELQPDLPEAYANMGNALRQSSRLAEAAAACRRAIELRPNYADAHLNLGNALQDSADLDGAIAAFGQVVALQPDLAEGHFNLANALAKKGRLDDAIAAYRHALRIKPDLQQGMINLAGVLNEKGEFDQAIPLLRQALALRPDSVEAQLGMATLLAAQRDWEGAILGYQKALLLRPEQVEAHAGLGNAWRAKGEPQAAIAAYRRALELKPDYVEVHSNIMFLLAYLADQTPAAIRDAHRRWNEVHALPLANPTRQYDNDRTPERRLRVGYVSADFRHHSVAYFLAPLLSRHDHGRFEVFCYDNTHRRDDVTERLRKDADAWRDIVGVGDEAVAEGIRQDRIDILVDLSGHTARNRLLVLARKPAPVQVTFLGYPATTGMTAIDYRLTDAWADPPGKTDSFCSEKLVRLPTCAWCFQPLDEAPPPLARGEGPVTFGCFNALAKISPAAVDLWAELLRRVPQSRLLLKARGLGDASVQDRVRGDLSRRGIAAERVELMEAVAEERKHLELYGRVDVALDTFPYHGTATTCQALWMGVPVVTLAGEAHVSRVGVSLLNNVGLAELVAQTPEEYVQIAARWAADSPRLAGLRAGLRRQMLDSPLMDANRYARDMETAYRTMWRTWCQG